MSDEETASDDGVGVLKGLAFVGMMILAAALTSDLRMNTSGHYKNRLNPAQTIEFKSGSYFSGTARVSCFGTTKLNWMTQDTETVTYSRTGDKVTLFGTAGKVVFAISNNGLTDSDGVSWDRVFTRD